MYSYGPTSGTGVMNPTTVPMNGASNRINGQNGASFSQPGYTTPYNNTPFGTMPYGVNSFSQGINNAPSYNTVGTPLCNSAYCATPFVNNMPQQTPFGLNSMPFGAVPTPFVGSTPFAGATPFAFNTMPFAPIAHPMSIAGATSLPFNTPVQNINGFNNIAPASPFVGTPSVNSFYPQSIVNNLAGISSFGLNNSVPFGWNNTGWNTGSQFGLNTPFYNNTITPWNNIAPFGASSVVNPLTVPTFGAWNTGITSPLSTINPVVSSLINSSITSPITTPWLGSSLLNSFGNNPFISSTLPQQILAQQALACQLGCCNVAPFGNVPFTGLNNGFGFGGSFGFGNSPFFGGLNNTVPFGGFNSTINPFVGGISPWINSSVTPFSGTGACDWNCCYN